MSTTTICESGCRGTAHEEKTPVADGGNSCPEKKVPPFNKGGACEASGGFSNKAKCETSDGGFKNIFARIRAVKHIEIYAAVAVIAVMVLIFFSSISDGNSPANAPTNNLTNVEQSFVRDMERNLVSTLSQVQGAGAVTVMVTAVGSSTLEIAMNIDERTVTQGSGNATTTTTTVTKTPIIVNGRPIVVEERKPQLRGIVILAAGANNPAVRLKLMQAVQALVADNTVNIQVLPRS